MKITAVCFLALVATLLPAVALAADSIKVGIIGLDTSHAIAFTQLLNAEKPAKEFEGCRVVAAYPYGSREIESSASRIPGYTEQVKMLDVEIVDSIAELLSRVDVVLLETNDGQLHLEQALEVIKAGKQVFIDKPVAASLTDVIAIYDAAEHYKVEVFSSSALRFGKETLAARNGALGKVLGCDTYSPCHLEPHHVDLFWYGIHGVESLFTVMQPGCKQVSRVSTPDGELVVGEWSDGRIGTFRGMRTGKPDYGGIAFGEKGNQPVGKYEGYEPLLREIVKFFRTGSAPVSREETLEIYAFMQAAQESKAAGGTAVTLASVLEKGQAEADQKRSW